MKKILTIILLAFGLSAGATKYYIATTGNNSNDGSVGNPWLTLSYACSQVTTAGDTIYVNSGTYNETARCNLSVGVSIVGVGDASNIVSTYYLASTDYGAISLYSSSAGTNGNQSISYIKLDGSNFTSYSGITVRYRSNVKIHHCTIVNFQTSGVNFRSNQVTASLSAAGSEPSPYEVGNEVHHCIITDCTDRSIAYSGLIKHDGQDGLKVYNNTLNANGKADGHTGNCITAWGSHDKNVKYYSNVMRKPVTETVTWNFCMEIGSVMGGVEIYDNEFYNGVGIDIAAYNNVKGASTYSVWIHNNLFTGDRRVNLVADAPHDRYFAITLEGGCNDIIINNNHVKDKPAGFSLVLGQTPRTFQNIYIYNNVQENIGYGDGEWIMCNQIRSYSTGNVMENIYFDNNTITLNTARCAFYIESSDEVSSVYFRNNIVKNIATGIGYGWLTFWDAAGTIADIIATNNLLYNNPNSNNPYYRNGKTVTNYVETGTLKVDPLFVSSSNFNLQSISPAVDAGVNTGVVTDYSGNTRVGSYDIGAYEYLPPIPPPTPTGTSTISTGTGKWFKGRNKVVVQ